MLQDLRQSELDLAEEKLLRSMFGDSLQPGEFTMFVLNSLGIDPNQWIKTFEGFMKPSMTSTGYVDGTRLRSMLSEKFPKIADMIPDKHFRLSEVTEELGSLIERIKP